MLWPQSLLHNTSNQQLSATSLCIVPALDQCAFCTHCKCCVASTAAIDGMLSVAAS